MTKASRNNRGSVKETTSGDWRTPPPLFKAFSMRYGIRYALDAAATLQNSLCYACITKETDTLSLRPDQIHSRFLQGVAISQDKNPKPWAHTYGIWTNPDYNNSRDLFKWMDLAIAYTTIYKVPWTFLVPSSRSEQDWYHRAIEGEPCFGKVQGRIRFNRPNGTPGSRPNHPSEFITFAAPPAMKKVFSVDQP